MLYLLKVFPGASPKAISGRTSYLRVRLAFHPYPQLLRAFFNRHRFGPPRSLTCALAWPWVDHTVSGLHQKTFFALLRLDFSSATRLKRLTSLSNAARWPVLQKAHRQFPSGCSSARGFKSLFHSPPGVLFTFPSRYSPLSITREYLALGGGPPVFTQSFSCSALLLTT